MSKIRQAVKYERKLAEAKLKAERDLWQQASTFERRLTDAQFHEVKVLADEHRIFHDREHILYEDAIEKAASGLQSQLLSLVSDVERLGENGHRYLTIERFERDHEVLEKTVAAAIERINEKLGAEEKVTVRQGAQQELLDKISANNKWLIGLAVTSGLSLAALLLHLAKLY